MTMKKIITILIAVTLLTGTFAGCSGSTNENETKEAVTTAKKVEVTTTEVPTEETTTEYQPKGYIIDFAANSLIAEYFSNRTINPGDKIVINEVCEQSLSPRERGDKVRDIIIMIYGSFYDNLDFALEFFDKYAIPGTGNYEFTYEENFVIEYEGNKSIRYDFVKEENDIVYIDFYLLD